MSDWRNAARLVLEAYDQHDPLGVVMEELRTAIAQQDRTARRTVTYVCPVCAASLERQE